MNTKPKRPIATTESPQCRNAARMSTLSGRHVPMKYTTPLDTKNLMGRDEFEKMYIRNHPGNRFTDDGEIVEIPESANHRSPVSPNTPTTATSTSATQRSDTVTSVGSNTTYQENEEEHAPTGCLGFGRPKTVKRKKDDSSDEYVKQSQKRLRRSSSWKSWYIEQGKDN